MSLVIAVIGRPNVGKSTLFNRLAGKKLAIVDDIPGVTRDRRYAEGSIGDIKLTLIDTAGFEDITDNSLEARMRQQTIAAIEEADICLFVTDARDGIVPLDKIFAKFVRERNKPVILVANKCEGNKAISGAEEAHILGLGEPIQISAEHGIGLVELYEAFKHFEVVDIEEEMPQSDAPINISFVGRPNAGKSSLINHLIGDERLLTGPEAGITRDSIRIKWKYNNHFFNLNDTAGLRKKSKISGRLEKFSTSDTIRAINFSEVVVLVMDYENAFEVQDLQIADLIEREGRAVVFAITKWDLVENKKELYKILQEKSDRLLPQLKGAPLITLSSITGDGVNNLFPAILASHNNWDARFKTKALNDWLALVLKRHPPPSVDGKRFKPKFITQVKTRPPCFAIFSSGSKVLPDHYKRYLVNSLRVSFGLPGIPIRLILKTYERNQETE